MKIFNYTNCHMCMKCRNDTKIELCKIFPVEICNRIANCNAYCSECTRVRHEEVDFLKVTLENTNMSTIERQLLFFKITNEHPLYARDSQKVKIQKMNRVLDNADSELNKVLKSYFSFSYKEICMNFVQNLACKKSLAHEAKYYHEDYFPYYKKHYHEATLFKLILYEYILALIGDNLHLMELQDIHDYLDEIFDK